MEHFTSHSTKQIFENVNGHRLPDFYHRIIVLSTLSIIRVQWSFSGVTVSRSVGGLLENNQLTCTVCDVLSVIRGVIVPVNIGGLLANIYLTLFFTDLCLLVL